MSARPLIILAIVGVILTAAVVLIDRPSQQAVRTDSLFAPALAEKLDEVQTVRIVGAGDVTVASLRRTEDDWVVAERDGYRANTNTIRSALTLLSRATVVEAKTANPDEFDRLGVESLSNASAGGVGIEFLPDSLGLPTIILGDSTGTSFRYARLADSNQSWLINADPQVPGEISQWLDTELLSVDGSRIERIVIEHADGERLEIFKSAPDQSNYSVAEVPEGRQLQYPGVANVIGNVLRGLRLEDVAAADTSVGNQEVTTSFETFDGLVVQARGIDVDGTKWLEFSATVDTQFSNPDEATAAEAAALNERLSGWRFAIPEYQYNQIARRMTDLLSATDTDE